MAGRWPRWPVPREEQEAGQDTLNDMTTCLSRPQGTPPGVRRRLCTHFTELPPPFLNRTLQWHLTHRLTLAPLLIFHPAVGTTGREVGDFRWLST